jgi:predicted O-methyltransferase YrrM
VAKSAAEEAALKRHPKVFELSYPAMLRSSVMEILERDLGLDASARARKGVLGDGQPIPLMSYAFIEYVMSLDLSGLVVLEIGGGNSTMFWARRAKSVLTFEHNRDWYDDVKGQIPSNVDLQFINQGDYALRVRALDASFDLIVIDCGANRYECAKAADGKLAAGGMVVLDNSDWYPNTAAALRAQDLIQIDFPDFRPDHWYRSCTSIFIHPEFRPKPRTGQLPLPVLGGKDLTKDNKWDRPF